MPKNSKQCESKIKMSENLKQLKSIKIRVDVDKGFYKRQGITKHEADYLLRKGYKQINAKSCFSNSKKKYLLKPRFNEGTNHFFLIMDIYNYLKDKDINVKLFQTLKPDIIFEILNNKIAIEIETGKVLRNNRKNLIEKVKVLNKNYDFWFFVLTNRNLTKKYKKYGNVVDKRYLKNYLNKLFLRYVEIY